MVSLSSASTEKDGPRTTQAVMEEVEDIGDLTEHYAIEQPYFSPSEKSLLLQYRMSRRHTGTLSPLSSAGTRYNSEYHPEPSTPPLLLSSPSAASLASSHGALSASASASAAFMSPVKRGAGLLQSALPLETPDFPPSHGRVALARRLGQLAQQLTTNADIDELTLTTQLERLEKAVAQSPARVPQYHSPAQFHMHHQNFQHRPARLGVRSQSDVGAMIATSSPAPSLHRSRYSDLSASMLARLSEINAAEFNEETREEPAPKKGMTGKQAEKVIIEATKLNKELSIVVDNLKARLEESDVSSWSVHWGCRLR